MCQEKTEIGISKNLPKIDIHVKCDCGEELKINLNGWRLVVVGGLIFECLNCHSKIKTYCKFTKL